jgi:hypothetical protein
MLAQLTGAEAAANFPEASETPLTFIAHNNSLYLNVLQA